MSKNKLNESDASEEAKKKGLEYLSFGRYGKNGKVTHKVVNNKLEPVDKNDRLTKVRNKAAAKGINQATIDKDLKGAEDILNKHKSSHPKSSLGAPVDKHDRQKGFPTYGSSNINKQFKDILDKSLDSSNENKNRLTDISINNLMKSPKIKNNVPKLNNYIDQKTNDFIKKYENNQDENNKNDLLDNIFFILRIRDRVKEIEEKINNEKYSTEPSSERPDDQYQEPEDLGYHNNPGRYGPDENIKEDVDPNDPKLTKYFLLKFKSPEYERFEQATRKILRDKFNGDDNKMLNWIRNQLEQVQKSNPDEGTITNDLCGMQNVLLLKKAFKIFKGLKTESPYLDAEYQEVHDDQGNPDPKYQ